MYFNPLLSFTLILIPLLNSLSMIFSQKGSLVTLKSGCWNGTATILAGLFRRDRSTPTGMKGKGGWWQTARKTWFY